MDKSLYLKIEEAKKLLKDNGYQTYNLWHIDDVRDDERILTDEDKMEILIKALTHEYIMGEIFFNIDYIKDDYIEQIKNKK